MVDVARILGRSENNIVFSVGIFQLDEACVCTISQHMVLYIKISGACVGDKVVGHDFAP